MNFKHFIKVANRSVSVMVHSYFNKAVMEIIIINKRTEAKKNTDINLLHAPHEKIYKRQ